VRTIPNHDSRVYDAQEPCQEDSGTSIPRPSRTSSTSPRNTSSMPRFSRSCRCLPGSGAAGLVHRVRRSRDASRWCVADRIRFHMCGMRAHLSRYPCAVDLKVAWSEAGIGASPGANNAGGCRAGMIRSDTQRSGGARLRSAIFHSDCHPTADEYLNGTSSVNAFTHFLRQPLWAVVDAPRGGLHIAPAAVRTPGT
jgi:hypothetical protein